MIVLEISAKMEVRALISLMISNASVPRRLVAVTVIQVSLCYSSYLFYIFINWLVISRGSSRFWSCSYQAKHLSSCGTSGWHWKHDWSYCSFLHEIEQLWNFRNTFLLRSWKWTAGWRFYFDQSWSTNTVRWKYHTKV